MDIRCRLCGEPWDHDELYEEWVLPPELTQEAVQLYENGHSRYTARSQLFRRHGCAVFGVKCGANKAPASVGVIQDCSEYAEEWEELPWNEVR